MALSHQNQGPATPGRKARRSWFDTPPLTHLDPHPVPRQHTSKRRSLDVVETLTLTHFTNPPRIIFGKAVIGKTKLRTLLLRNPHDFEQEVIVERFPYKKKFMVNETRFTVGPESTWSLEITWTPEEAGGYREMVQFHINEVYRLQAFLIGTADKPKPQRKIRKFPLGPCVRHPPTVVQTSALSSIKTSYSPNSRQVAEELMEDMQTSHLCSMEDKENSGSKRHDSQGTAEIQDGGVLKLNEVPPVNETANATAPRKMQVKDTAEDEGFKTPTPLESTAILGKQEAGREFLKNRRQWRNISDITSPTLNMSPIPVNEGTEHGMTVDSYFQPNETCNPAQAKADKLSDVGRSKNVKRNLIQKMSPKGTGKDLKDTFVIPLAPAKSTRVVSNLDAADNKILMVSGNGEAVSTAQQQFQQQTVKADETRIIKVNGALLKTQCPMEDSLALSEQLTSEPVGSSAERSTNLHRTHLDVNKNSDMSPPKIPRDNSLFDPSQVSPRTMLDESLSLISQVRMPLRGTAVYSDDKCPSINSSLISQGQGTVSPNSFMEDMRSMMQNSHCGSDNEHKNTSTPNIPSPSIIINSSIPHNIMVNHLESVRLSLHDSPMTVGSERGTPKMLQKTTVATRKSITSQFQKEEKKRIATVANVFKKDQQLMGDSNKHFTNKYNVFKKHALVTKSNGRAQNLYATRSPKRETFYLKKKEAEEKKAAMRSPLGKRSVLRRSPPNRRSPLSSPQEFDIKKAKNKKGKRKSSPLKPGGRTSQVKKSPSTNSDPIMPEIMSKIKANMMMMTGDSDNVWNLVTPQKDVPLPGPHTPEANYVRNLLPAESKETDEIIKESTVAKKIKLFPDLHESACYEECLMVKNKQIKVTASDMDRNTEDATDADKTREQEVLYNTGFVDKLCVSETGASESSMTKRSSKSQAERVVTGADRALSAQRFYTLSPSNLPTSPELYLDQSRRGTITVTKSRPSDALLTAINNRKRLFQDSPQKTPYSITDDDKETQENISVKFEEHYQEIDGKIYVIVKETTDVVKSTTETYIEEMPISPQQFETPVKLPNSPDLLVSRRSTHLVRSPKVINFGSMNRRQLDFVDAVESSVVGGDQPVNFINEKALGNDKELNSSELSEDNCSVIKSDTFEKEPSLHITADRHDIFTDNSAAAITSVCSISRRLVNYDDGSETCSTGNVTKDSLDISQSTDSLGCSFNEAQASLEDKKPTDEKQIDKEDMPFAMDADDSIIQLNWDVMTKDEPDINVFESDQRNDQDLKNICRRNDKHLVAADEESEDEQFYDTMSDKYYDAMSDAGNPEVEQIDELKQAAMSSRSLESITAESDKYSADSCFGIFRPYHCEAEERPDCSVLAAVPSIDTCVPLADASATTQARFDEQTDRAEVSIDHREMFEIVDRQVINLCSAVELQPVEEVVRSTPEAKAKRKLRRSASACELLEHQHDACDLLENQHLLNEAASQNLCVPITTTPTKLMTSSKSAVLRHHAGQVLTKFSPKNVSKGQPPSSTTTQVMVKKRSQSMFDLARQAERVRAVRTEHTSTTNRAVRTEHTSTTNRAVRTEHTTTTNRAARQASQVSQSASKQKSTKGVAQSKLFLVKKSKTVAPRHPMLYAAKNMYYDERWMEKQERGFTQWLNFVLTPPDDYVAVVNKAKVDARSLSLDVEHVTPRLAPTKEILSFRAYTARRQLNRLRRGACQLYQSDAVVSVIRKIEVEVESRRISARRDKMMHADVGIKQKLLDLLLHYSPLWLRIGLETIFGEVLMLQSNQDVMGLSRFILTRLLASPDIAAEFAHPTVPHLYKEGYVDSVSRHTVKKFLLLVYFLDQAKLVHLIDYDPCLFCKDAGIKSSKEILIEFSREVLSGEGDITRHLAYFGCTVSHSQKPIDEFDFAVSNLSSDLRDGLRLCRVLEFLAGDHNIMAKLRTPAISRLQKIHNIELFFKAVHEQGLDFHLAPGMITPRDVVDGHREKTLSLLWQLIIHFQSSVLVNEKHLREEIDMLTKSLRLKIAMQKIGALSMEDCQARRDSGETKLLMENQRLQLLFQWCQLVCLHYGLKVENFTVSFSDGRALCCLLHHYQPALLPLAEIRFETTISLQESAVDKYQQGLNDSTDMGIAPNDSDDNNPDVFERLLANEKSNFKTLYEKTSTLGGIPLMLKLADMSNTIPDEKVVSTFVSYLCARLLDIREEVKAARIIQMGWRKKQLRKAFLEKQRKTKAAITIQQWFRSLLAKHKKARETENLAAVLIQAAWRGLAARLYVGRLKQMIQEGDQEDHKELSDGTSKSQRPWQSELMKHYHMILLKQQKCVRRREEEAAITIQKHVRRFHCRQEFTKQQASVIKIQDFWRRHLAKRILCTLKQEKMDNSAVVIQKWMRRYFCLNQYRKKKNAVLSLQKVWRMRQSRRTQQTLRAESLSRAATTIQKHVRARLVHKKFQKIKVAAVVVQVHWRMKQAKRELAVLKSERDNKAAIILQNYMKSIICRQKYIRLRNATIILQRSWRKKVAQWKLLALKTEVDNNAAVVIQKYFKRYKTQRQYCAQQKSIVLIQSTWRMLQAKKELQSLKQKQRELSATLIQCCYRSFRCRQEFQKYRKAAITIQKTWRMYSAQNMRKLQLKNKIQAGITIQRLYRGFIQRRSYIQLKHSAVVLQKWWRLILAKKLSDRLRHQQQQENAALVLQRNFRMWKQRSYFLKLKSAAVVLQTAWRMVRDRRLFIKLKLMKQERSALCIQKVWRGHVTRQVLATQRRAACVIQSWWKMIQTKQQYWCMKEAALLIQAWYRAAVLCKHQRSVFLNQRASAVYIQSWWRSTVLQQKFQTMRHSAVVIQAHYRRFQCRCKFLAVKEATVVIQRHYRSHIRGLEVRKEYLTMKRAAATIQNSVRTYLQRRHERQQTAALILQTAFRKVQAHRKYTEQKQAAETIQKYFREYLKARSIRQSFLHQKQAAETIQRYFREYQKTITTRQQFLHQKQAAETIQRYFREYQKTITARQQFLHQKQAAETIQRYFREYQKARTIRQQFLHQKQAAETIQRYFREYQKTITARQQFLHQKQAAETIQRYFREYQKARTTRQQFLHQKQAAQTIQRYFRDCQKARTIRQQFLHQKQAAETIQRYFRKYQKARTARQQYLHQKQAAETIQRYFREYQKTIAARQQFLHQKQAAETIQRYFREYQKTRSARQHFLHQKQAAETIQRYFREYQKTITTRQQFLHQKQAAQTIQRYFRDCQKTRTIRQQFLHQKQAAETIQRYFREYQKTRSARQQFLHQKQAAETIQRYFREYKKTRSARQQFLHQKQAAQTIQRYFRDCQKTRTIRQKFLHQKQAAETIQRYFREYKKTRSARQQFLHQKQAAQTIQRYFRDCQKTRTIRQQFLHQKQAAETIQRYFREYQKTRSARQQFLHQKQAAIIIQMTYRAFLIRKQYLHIHQSVIKIQAHIRGRITRKHFQKLKHAAVTIQVHFRAVRLSRIYYEAFLQLKTSAIIIQRFYRSAIVERKALKDLAHQHAAATRIQAVYRGWRQNNKYLLLQAAAVIIQRWYRACLAGRAVRAEIVRMGQAACVIQKRFRFYKMVQEARRQIQELRTEKEREMIRKLEKENCDSKRQLSVTNDEVQEEKRQIQELKNEKEGEIIRTLEEENCDIKRQVSLTNAEVQETLRQIQELRTEEESEIIKKLAEEEDKCDIKRGVSVANAEVQEANRQIEELRNEKEGKIIRKPGEEKCNIKRQIQELRNEKEGEINRKLEEEKCDIRREMNVTNAEAQEAIRQHLRMEGESEIIRKLEEEEKWDIKRGVSVTTDEVQETKRQIQEVRNEKQNEIVRKQKLSKSDMKGEVNVPNTGVDRKTEEIRREHASIVIQKIVREYPSPCTVQQLLDASGEFESSDTEKEYMEMRWQQLEKEETLNTQSSCHAYKSCKALTRHLTAIDINCTDQNFQGVSHQEQNASAVVIQRAVRKYICRRKMIKIQCIVVIQASIRRFLARCHLQARLRSVVMMQTIVRGWLARRSTAVLRKRHNATVCLQAHVRGYLVRKKFSVTKEGDMKLATSSCRKLWLQIATNYEHVHKDLETLLQEKIQSVWKQKKEQGAAIVIQAKWRGFITRRNTTSRRLTQARKRLREANRQATEEKTLGSRTSSALDFLLREKDVGHILEALMHLEVCTRLSPVCCERMAEVNAVPGLYRLISSCNRSVPHMELIKYSLNILLNLAKYEKTIAAVLEPQGSVATILELMLIYREKGAIFNYCCMLLGILGLHPERRAVILKHPLIIDRLQSIHALTLRKHRMNKSRQVMQAKMAALRSFNCTLSVLTPSKCKLRRIKPEWALARDAIKDFDDSVTAVTFVMDSLQIGPKM